MKGRWDGCGSENGEWMCFPAMLDGCRLKRRNSPPGELVVANMSAEPPKEGHGGP